MITELLKSAYHLFLQEHPTSLFVVWQKKRKMMKGFEIYSALLKKYAENTFVNICPYQGTGDVYLAAGYFNKSSFKSEPHVFCVIGKSNYKIARLFGIENIEVLSKKEMELLFFFSVFAGLNETNVHILHPNPPYDYAGVIDCFRNINRLVFTDIIGYGAFNCKDSKNIALPVFSDCDESMQRLFEQNGLIKGRTVLFAPYSYTMATYSPLFWKKLAEKLKEMGYAVCTNIGTEKEQAVEGTVGVFLRYEELSSFLKMAGYFIGVRSGLCEVVSSIPCKKIILYGFKSHWGFGDDLDYFNLKDMGLCNDAVELRLEEIDFYHVIKKIEEEL
ncbi:MAG: hypothetical protein IJ828_07000 [Treponema sp.]|nr:hypothetical protein [Treponema sp.]